MNGFQYKHGDRPLDGYTIQRAIGRGGFGEVYFALSDSGREVALKTVQGYEQVELRGVSQCMNLKSPYLVSIFDVRRNDEGLPFVIMEYVNGDTLREIIDQSPGGIGPQRTAFFLREIAKGLTYLHDRGIVHRDLKPGNIFFEDGYVKIGDYGLSKAMSASVHSGQTITVGTVHYMAPEIGQGRYDKAIDIYAMGVLVYEMLTGQTPYLGGSAGEVLMKHLSAEPDLSAIEEPFASVIRKAMAKQPEDRFSSVQAMVEAVFGAAHIRESVSHFRPETLSMAAGRVAAKIGIGGSGSSVHPGGHDHQPPYSSEPSSSDVWSHAETHDQAGATGAQRWSDHARRWGEQTARRLGLPKEAQEQILTRGKDHKRGPAELEAMDREALARDPVTWPQRRVLALMTAALMGAVAGWLETTAILPWHVGLLAFVWIAGAADAITSARLGKTPHMRHAGTVAEQLSYVFNAVAYVTVIGILVALPTGALDAVPKLAVLAGLGVLIALVGQELRLRQRRANEPGRESLALEGGYFGIVFSGAMVWALTPYASASFETHLEETFTVLGKTMLAMVGATLLFGWRAATRPDREERISLGEACWVGAYGFGLAAVLNGETLLAAAMMAGLLLAVQALSPFDAEASEARKRAKKTRKAKKHGKPKGRDKRDGAMRSPDRTDAPAGHRPPPPPRHAEASPARSAPRVNPHRPTAASDVTNVSSRMRLWAVLLACAGFLPPPLAGLHRFYAGKIWTGLLWFFTGGLVGVGTVIDIIYLAMGKFTDSEGRPLLAWTDLREVNYISAGARTGHALPSHEVQPPPPPTAPGKTMEEPMPPTEPPKPRSPSSPKAPRPYERWGGVHPVLAALGGILLTQGLVLGFAMAIDLPTLIAAGWPDPDLARELTEDVFGYDGWPALMAKLIRVLFFGTMLGASFFILISRMRAGFDHVLRALLGLGCLFFAIKALADVMEHVRWGVIMMMANQDKLGPAIEEFLNQTEPRATPAVAVGLLMLMGLLLLCWPARRRKTAAV